MTKKKILKKIGGRNTFASAQLVPADKEKKTAENIGKKQNIMKHDKITIIISITYFVINGLFTKSEVKYTTDLSWREKKMHRFRGWPLERLDDCYHNATLK